MITSLTSEHLNALSTEELRALLILTGRRVVASTPGTSECREAIRAWERILDVLEGRRPDLAHRFDHAAPQSVLTQRPGLI